VPAWPADVPVLGEEPALVVVGGEPAGWWAPAGSAAPAANFLEDPLQHAPEGTAVLRFEGVMLHRVWELVVRSAGQVARDVAALFVDAPAPAPPAGVHLIGDDPLILGAEVQIEPGVVLDTREGPIWLETGVRVRSFTRLCGPAYIGRETVLEGGSLSAVTVGPVCHLHGEVEETVVLGYSNKHHEGFLGHAYLGRWVNLGAFTTNSNLKNNYGTIDLWTPDGPLDTGEIKMGCLLGDHVKTGIGTLLNTGTVVEAACNLYGNEMPPKYVAPFSWGTGSALVEYECERFLRMAETMMSRRNVTLTDGLKRLLRAVAASRTNGAQP
jgi:UDP-N-acetylglucosamine diphosphorylase/glucosamine-1-phosphate N-acetyltransferase